MEGTAHIFYYGVLDGWAPLEFAARMNNRLEKRRDMGRKQNGVVLIDKHDCEHAFVVHQSEKVAETIAEYFPSYW